LGVVNIAAGVSELFSILISRHVERHEAPSISATAHHPAEE
jgi:hypothetical protein